MLRDALIRIAHEYPQAIRDPLERHPLAAFIRVELPRALAGLIHARPGYEDVVVEGTKFVGNWAKTPWLAILDPRLTRTAQRGVYVVIAFSKDFLATYVSLGIGVAQTTPPQRESLISHLQSKFPPPAGFNLGPIRSGSEPAEIKTKYDDAQVFYKSYPVDDLPSEPELMGDLYSVVDLLRSLAATDDSEIAKILEPKPVLHYSVAEVRAAFGQTVPDQWQSKPGIEPYWHVFVDGQSKPVKAVFATLTGQPTSSFNTVEARSVFSQMGFETVDTRPATRANETARTNAEPPQLCLIGTAKEWKTWLPECEEMIREKGEVANWWSFRIRDEAKPLLRIPFYLYLNAGRGQFPVRARIAEYASSPSVSGMESPWPDITLDAERDKTRDGMEQSHVFRTWFKISAFEHLEPAWTLGHFSPAPGLSDNANLLNQNAFGYAYAHLETMANTVSTVLATSNDDVEGLDLSQSEGWGGDYPLDSVFVRTETRTVQEVVRRIEAGRYQLDPDYQRDFVWPVDKQSRLIESCVMRIPLPVFYVAEAHDGRIAVVDGLQRLTTFSRYLANEFELILKAGEDQPHHPLDGKRYSSLPLNLQERIQDTQLTLYILDAKAPERAKLDIFERVNSGVPLTRQQMRNCLFNGPATQWLKKAASSDEFLKATGRTLDSRSMRDREAINRFCGFSLLGESRYVGGDMDGFLARALDIMQNGSINLDDLFAKFSRSMRANQALFKAHAFRKSLAHLGDHYARTVVNIALFDVCSVLLADVDIESLDSRAQALRQIIADLIKDSEFNNAITYSTNSTRQVKRRFAMARDALAGVIS